MCIENGTSCFVSTHCVPMSDAPRNHDMARRYEFSHASVNFCSNCFVHCRLFAGQKACLSGNKTDVTACLRNLVLCNTSFALICGHESLVGKPKLSTPLSRPNFKKINQKVILFKISGLSKFSFNSLKFDWKMNHNFRLIELN